MEKYISFIGEYNNESGSSDVTEFTLSIGSAGAKEWNGTVWYSTDTVNWSIWDGSTITSGNKRLYLRGKNNTTFYTTKGACLQLSRKAKCFGNINVLLDYDNPPLNVYDNCYKSLFDGCSNLLRAPSLPATSLAASCYFNMFKGCSSLTDVPELPAQNIPTSAYQYMFQNCTSLTKLPILPAQTVAMKGYYGMFYGCSLIKVSATKIGDYKTNWRIPSDGTSVSFATNATFYMLFNTGGTFTGSGASNKISENTVFYGSWTSEENVFYKTLLKTSYVCQLFDKDKFFATRTAHGVVFTNNGDGSFTINGTCNSDADADTPLFLPPTEYTVYFDLYSIENHKYLLIPFPQAFSYSTLRFVFGSEATAYYETSNTYEIYTATKTGTYPCYAIYRVGAGTTINNLTVKPQLFDLTEMYGAGNEPTTLAEFRQKYPNDLYPYGNNSIFAESYKTEVICNTKNMFYINLSTNWQPPVNHSYEYVPIFIGVGKTCTISWNLDYYKSHLAPYSTFICVNNGEQPSNLNRTWIWHQTSVSSQNSQVTVSANSTGYIYFECAVSSAINYPYIFNENLKWQLELGSEKTDYIPHIVNITTYKSKIKT